MTIVGDGRTPTLGRTGVFGFCIVAICLAAALLIARPQFFGGDEPRYLMYASSLWHEGRFVMTPPEWRQFNASLPAGTQKWDYPADPTPGRGVLMNGVYIPTLLAPVVGLLGLHGVRALTLLIGLAGLFFLFRLCRRVGSTGAALLATAVAGFSIPLLPFLHIFYMEAFLFAWACFVWDRLQKSDRSVIGDLVTAAVILLVPFIHLRGSGVGAAFFLALLWQQHARRRYGAAAAMVALAAVVFGVFAVLNVSIYGAVLGPVNTARPPLPWQWSAVLPMQLFSVSHGLIAYAPVWLLGYAGLLGGAARGAPLMRPGLALAVIAAATGIGIFPGGSWTARFWVLSIPMLAVGLSLLWEIGRPLLVRGIAAFLIAATLANSTLFFFRSDIFLEDRQSTASYQRLFETIGLFDVGLMLPAEPRIVDAADEATRTDPADLAVARALAVAAAIIVLSLALGLVRPRSIYAVPAALLILTALDLAHVGVVPPADYTVERTPQGFAVALRTTMPAGYVQFGHYWQAWFNAPDWPRFEIAVTGADGRQAATTHAANQVIAASCVSGLRRLSVAGPPTFDFAEQLHKRLIVYRSESLLMNTVGWLRGRC